MCAGRGGSVVLWGRIKTSRALMGHEGSAGARRKLREDGRAPGIGCSAASLARRDPQEKRIQRRVATLWPTKLSHSLYDEQVACHDCGLGELLGALVERIDYQAHALDRVKRSCIRLVLLGLGEDDQTAGALVEDAFELLVEDHLCACVHG
jgi:hypothetical protein